MRMKPYFCYQDHHGHDSVFASGFSTLDGLSTSFEKDRISTLDGLSTSFERDRISTLDSTFDKDSIHHRNSPVEPIEQAFAHNVGSSLAPRETGSLMDDDLNYVDDTQDSSSKVILIPLGDGQLFLLKYLYIFYSCS